MTRRTAQALPLILPAIVLVSLFLAAIAPRALARYDYRQLVASATRFEAPSQAHWLGVDGLRRDVLSRMVWAARATLGIAVLSVLAGLAGGSLLGLPAGFLKGRSAFALQRLIDLLLTFPPLLFGLMVVAALGSSYPNLVLAIGIGLAARFARVIRNLVVTVASLEYIEGARALGASDVRVVLAHIVPNIAGTVGIVATLYLGNAIRVEAALSFLGLGIRPPMPSWGSMVREGMDYLWQAAWLVVFPGLAIMLAVMCFNLLGDTLRDYLDPRLK
ncbi:MAG: ABC transporter permease [Candidatus Rokubacteria bacterium]|nr:ABC transporter permease [Candidatus Rokubacteria bacterium]